ncbi:MAG: signal peptide peptidase SppA [Rhodocyclaceae bacterium]|nr:signal peptide peptidase SppA [Rhodocyclaceae bacterium]
MITGLFRLLRLLWQGLNFTRRLIANALLVLVLLLLFGGYALFANKPAAPPPPEGAALFIRPQGAITEQLERASSFDLLMDAQGSMPGAALHEYIEAIDVAAGDSRITGLVLETGDIAGASLGRLAELRAAIERFRAAGKPVYAWGERFTQGQYFLASAADRVHVSPDGAVLLAGLARYQNYFKSALDKIGVKVHVFRVGAYKSFGEPFTRDEMSEEDRQSTLDLLTGLWGQMRQTVEKSRKLTPEALADYVQRYPDHLARTRGDAAQAALDAGLVDELLTRDQWQAQLRARFGADADDPDSFRKVTPARYLAHAGKENASAPVIAVLTVQGTIIDGETQAGTTGGDTLAAQIRKARNDARVRALVLRIDSPGGSAFASELIRRELQLTRNAGKPVIASMSGTAASGGYWVASGADEIWALPSTLTGSIGIFALLPELVDTANHLGIHTDGVGTAPLAGLPDPLRPLPPDAQRSAQLMLEHGYRRFLEVVAEARKMSPREVDQVGQGRVWTGEAAHKLGLVDQLGTLPQAIAAAAARAGIAGEPQVRWEVPEPSLGEMLLSLLGELALTDARARPSLASTLLQQWRTELAALHTLNDPQNLYAHCFCDLSQTR